ncbi:MAG TPA: hypothetical protein VGM03_24200 [Phycisphaerae bacterium]|jgi:hypothetical protein
MPKAARERFLQELHARFPTARKLANTQSLYDIGGGAARLYIRYSRRHPGNTTFYGLRRQDLRELEGRCSFICFLWDEQFEPLVVPFGEYEEVFHTTPPAPDGQYKSQVLLGSDVTELYIANAGRFNVESCFGWDALDAAVQSATLESCPTLTHSQVQTLLGAIGFAKGYDVWIPASNRGQLDWSCASPFGCRERLPLGYESVACVLEEVDVVWIGKGSTELSSLFEVEHSTPSYSGLLRFNDIHLAAPSLRPRFNIVANDERRSVFARQLNHPTFRTSGLSEMCSFLEYVDVYGWYQRVARSVTGG